MTVWRMRIACWIPKATNTHLKYVIQIFHYTNSCKKTTHFYVYTCIACLLPGTSLTRGPRLLSMYTVEQRGFLVHKYWQTGSFKACQTVFRTEFGERRAPSKCCIQKLVKKLETRGSRSNTCRLLSLGAY